MNTLARRLTAILTGVFIGIFSGTPFTRVIADDFSYPVILLEEYRVTGNLAAGEDFVLEYTLRNTSSSAGVNNIVIEFDDPADVFYPSQGKSNQGYLASIARMAVATGEIPLTVKSTTAEGIHNLSFRLFYQGEFSGVAMMESSGYITLEVLGIPFEATEVSLSGQCEEGKEAYVSVGYRNNSSRELHGVKFLLEGNIDEAAKELAVGTVPPGASGVAEGYVTFLAAGKQELAASPVHEDADGQLVEYEPVRAVTSVVGAAVVPDTPAPSGYGGFLRLAETAAAPVILAAAILCAVALAVMLLRPKRGN